MVRSASDLILSGINDLAAVLKTRAFEFKDTVQIGRTHGMHAEPITFGLKLALWYDEVQRNLTRFSAAAEGMRVGKISGAVGTFGHIGPQAEERICQRLGLRPAPIASQVISRDRHANYVATLALVAATLEKIALEIRHLQRTEVREVEEPFARRPKGLVGHAAQAEPGDLRADLRAGPRGPRQRPARLREHRALARARYFPLLGGADHPARYHHRGRLHAGANDLADFGPARLARENEAKSGTNQRPGVLRTAPAGPVGGRDVA